MKTKPNNTTDWEQSVEYWVYQASKGENVAKCWQNIKKYISSELQREREEILNRLHAIVCDLSNKNQNPELKKEDCLEIIRYQIERINGKKLEKVKL